MITPFRVTLLALIIGVSAAVLVSFRTPPPPPEEQLAEAPPPLATTQPVLAPQMQLAKGIKQVTPSGLTIIETTDGTGPTAKPGDSVAVNYSGYLYYGGEKFDSSYDRGDPLTFTLGQPGMIAGFDEGITGMKVGGKRELILPPNLAYGDRAMPGGKIPPGSTLVFDVELMSIK